MRAAARLDDVGIAGAHPYGPKRHAQPIGDDLREGCFMPLPGCLSADDKVDATIRQDRDVRALARDPAGRLDVVCNPDAGELAALTGGLAALREARPVRDFERTLHGVHVVAAVVG